MSDQRVVFFVSDGTGITAETLGNTLLTQFDTIEFKKVTLPFVSTPEKARMTVEYINHVSETSTHRPIVISTTTSVEVRAMLQHTRTLFLDLFDTYLHRLELELGQKATHSSGRAHGIANSGRYYERIAAVDFAMEHDDGQSTRGLDRAEIILIAPSRCGKTPTSIYLALQHALFATNFPLTDEDLESQQLPATMQPFKGRLFGLTSDPARLHQVRNERRGGSKYASLAQCAYELRQAEQLYRRFEIPFVNSANMSIEEIATVVLEKMQLRR